MLNQVRSLVTSESLSLMAGCVCIGRHAGLGQECLDRRFPISLHLIFDKVNFISGSVVDHNGIEMPRYTFDSKIDFLDGELWG
jgi:hypothetical protein